MGAGKSLQNQGFSGVSRAHVRKCAFYEVWLETLYVTLSPAAKSDHHATHGLKVWLSYMLLRNLNGTATGSRGAPSTISTLRDRHI